MKSELAIKTVFPTASGSHGAFILSSGILFQVMCGCGDMGVGVCGRGGQRGERGRRERGTIKLVSLQTN